MYEYSQKHKGVLLAKIVAVLIFLFTFAHAQSEYELGKGVRVASLPLYVGGYFSLDYKYMDDESRYRVDDVAVLAYGGYDKFSYMAELEFKELYVESEHESKENTHLYVERLYLDYNLNESTLLRMGKYNSPIGFWNMLPINVLRETSSSPMSTYLVFPKFTTGVNGSYTSYSEGELKIDLMLQYNEDIDDDYNNYELDEHYGFGISYEKDEYAFKLNGGSFHNISDDVEPLNLYYALVSLKYEDEKYQLLSELGSQKSSSMVTTKYAGYIQCLYRFTEQHIGILRLESYDDMVHDVNDKMAIVGYTYRPSYPIAIKSEYQFHSLEEENQFLFSISVLF